MSKHVNVRYKPETDQSSRASQLDHANLVPVAGWQVRGRAFTQRQRHRGKKLKLHVHLNMKVAPGIKPCSCPFVCPSVRDSVCDPVQPAVVVWKTRWVNSGHLCSSISVFYCNEITFKEACVSQPSLCLWTLNSIFFIHHTGKTQYSVRPVFLLLKTSLRSNWRWRPHWRSTIPRLRRLWATNFACMKELFRNLCVIIAIANLAV